MTIDFATKEDWPLLCPLMRELHTLHAAARPDIYRPFDAALFESYYRLTAETPEHIYLLARENKKALGYAHLVIRERKESSAVQSETVLIIEELATSPHSRRRGVGSALMNEARRLAYLKGARRLELCVWAFNEDAAAFYRTQGFSLQRSILEQPLEKEGRL